MTYLTEDKVNKALTLMDELNDKETNLSTILYLFEEIFGYSRSEVYLCDQHHNLKLIAYSNFEKKIFTEYWDNFHQYNTYWHPKLLFSSRKQSAIRVFDAVSKNFYENSRFYTEYLKRYNFYHLMTMSLMYNNNVYGCITFTRLKDEKPFDTSDVLLLEVISRFLSPKILKSLNRNDINFLFPNNLPDMLINHLLSKREKEILHLVKRGLSNKELANELFISVNTVKTHLLNIYRKLDVSNRTELTYLINRKIPID